MVMPATEVHHQKDGVLVAWGHTCGHLSNPIHYDTLEKAETVRAGMESRPCWECLETRRLAKGRR